MLKQNQCEGCPHRQVCAIQIEYRAAIKAVEEARANIGEKTSKEVRNMPITISMECDYFLRQEAHIK